MVMGDEVLESAESPQVHIHVDPLARWGVRDVRPRPNFCVPGSDPVYRRLEAGCPVPQFTLDDLAPCAAGDEVPGCDHPQGCLDGQPATFQCGADGAISQLEVATEKLQMTWQPTEYVARVFEEGVAVEETRIRCSDWTQTEDWRNLRPGGARDRRFFLHMIRGVDERGIWEGYFEEVDGPSHRMAPYLVVRNADGQITETLQRSWQVDTPGACRGERRTYQTPGHCQFSTFRCSSAGW